MPTEVIYVSVFAVLVTVAVLLVVKRGMKQRASRFMDRESISPAEICRLHLPEASHKLVEECLEKLSKVTGVDPGKLRLGDRFDVELKLPNGCFIAGEWDDIEDDIGASGTSIEEVKTIRDYILARSKNLQRE